MATRAQTVNLASLSKSIDKAVALASKRYDVTLGPGNVIHNWEILGRVLRDMNRLSTTGAIDVAATIAKGAGLKGTPVVTKIGKDILVGVIARDLNVRF